MTPDEAYDVPDTLDRLNDADRAYVDELTRAPIAPEPNPDFARIQQERIEADDE